MSVVDENTYALTAPELWMELLLHDVRGASSDVTPAERCLLRLHADGQPGALRTALLLLTAWRWRRCTARLLPALLESGVLTDTDLDGLAHSCLYEDAACFDVPAETFDGPVNLLVDLGPEPLEDVPDVGAPDVLHMLRPLQPPVRRWAATRLVRAAPQQLPRVRERIDELPPRHAAAAMNGVLDALDCLPHAVVDAVLADARAWPHATVRTLAAARDPSVPAAPDLEPQTLF